MSTNKNELPTITPKDNPFGYVGLYIEGGKLKIAAPKTLRFSDDTLEKKAEILSFLKTINLAKTFENKDSNNSREEGCIWPFDSYLWMIRDYINNGIFYNRSKQYSNNNKGKIEWKKTLKETPIVSNGNIIYDKFITSKTSATNDTISRIYRYCVNISAKRIGWLFNFNTFLDGESMQSKQEMIYTIDKELSNTFDDIKTMRFRHMASILTNISDNENTPSEYIFGINNYYYVFEKMVNTFFNGISDAKRKTFDPKGFWKLNASSKTFPSSNLRPDTIVELGDTFYVLDSKMYKFGFTGNPDDLPETASIQKQVTYGDLIKTKEPTKNVRNAFIISFNKELPDFYKGLFDYELEKIDSEGNMQYLGYAFPEWKSNEVPKLHNYIFAYLIDLNYLVMHYQNDKDEEAKQLIENIETKCLELQNSNH